MMRVYGYLSLLLLLPSLWGASTDGSLEKSTTTTSGIAALKTVLPDDNGLNKGTIANSSSPKREMAKSLSPLTQLYGGGFWEEDKINYTILKMNAEALAHKMTLAITITPDMIKECLGFMPKVSGTPPSELKLCEHKIVNETVKKLHKLDNGKYGGVFEAFVKRCEDLYKEGNGREKCAIGLLFEHTLAKIQDRFFACDANYTGVKFEKLVEAPGNDDAPRIGAVASSAFPQEGVSSGQSLRSSSGQSTESGCDLRDLS